ncbi:hypothetical protein BJX64DRAFT_260019 [Aspergillus heterothallicus]
MCLVPWQHAAPLPDNHISWSEAATLPVAVQVPLSAWDALGIPRVKVGSAPSSGEDDAVGAPQGANHKAEALLVWGASSSVGTMGVQTASILRDDPTSSIGAVYATAGAANHEYISSLGADRIFDYNNGDVVDAIIAAARDDGLAVRHCFLATGNLVPCQAILKAFVGEGSQSTHIGAKIASAPPIPPDAAVVDGVETIFVTPSMDDEEKRLAQFEYWMGTWLRETLANGKIRPSPLPKVVGRGQEAINVGLDELAKGVSCVKLVVEVGE